MRVRRRGVKREFEGQLQVVMKFDGNLGESAPAKFPLSERSNEIREPFNPVERILTIPAPRFRISATGWTLEKSEVETSKIADRVLAHSFCSLPAKRKASSRVIARLHKQLQPPTNTTSQPPEKMAQSIAVPGQLLGPVDKFVAGAGTHIYESNLYSSLLGTVTIVQPEKGPGPAKRLTKISALTPSTLPTISVSRSGISEKREVLPEVNNVVLCRVTRITPRQATAAILVVGDTVLEAEWQGVIRVQDVRATEKDRVKIYESFRPGDIVRAQVVSGTF